MADYKRLVSYIYSYNNGIKSKNIGFGRVEKRDSQVRILLNLKGAYSDENRMTVYFYTRKDRRIEGISIGQIEINQGFGEFFAIKNVGEFGVPFDSLCGLYIMGDSISKVFASQWDDISFDINDINMPEEDAEEDAEVRATSDILNEQAVPEVADIPTEDSVPIWERPIKEAVFLTPDEIDSEPEYVGLFSNARYDIFCDDDIYSCTDIDLEQLKELPKEMEVLSNNSFLCHGFYNYRHLLLGKKDDSGLKYGLVLGVPGIYNRRERASASMYGFDGFKFSTRPDVKECHFGYWYRAF